jgi:hypothetical protein
LPHSAQTEAYAGLGVVAHEVDVRGDTVLVTLAADPPVGLEASS